MIVHRTTSRRNGLQPPFNRYQIIGWVLFLAELASTILVFVPPLEAAIRVTCGVVLVLLLCLSLLFAFLSSFVDPTDPAVYEERKARDNGEEYVTELKHFCSLCDTHVQSRTKHCGQCNRCVNTFDHHCQWLNNCIGERNYGLFAKAVGFLFLNATAKIIVGAYVLYKYYNGNNEFITNAQQFYQSFNNFAVLQVFVILSMIINFLFWLMMIQLIILHVWLKKNKMTTYEYIVKKRENIAIKKALKEGAQAYLPKKSKVIKKIDDEIGLQSVATHQGHSDNTVMKLMKSKATTLPNDHSHLLSSHHDMTNQEFAKQRPGDKHAHHNEPFGVGVNSIPDQSHTKSKLITENKSPIAIYHETSMSIDDSSANDDLGTSDQNKASTATFKEMSNKKHKHEPEDYISDDDDHHISPAPKAHDDDDVAGGTVETEGNPMGTEGIMEDEEDVQHIELPEIECDISGEKSVETSKIMKLMETVRDNVLFKNPLNRIIFAGSGIDMDGSNDQTELVSSPRNTNLFKPILPPLNIGGTRSSNFKAFGANDLKGLKSEVYYVNSPQARDALMSPAALLPNSCRINMEKRGDQYPYNYIATERKVYGGESKRGFGFGSARNSNIPDDESITISMGSLGKPKKSARSKNPFFK